MNSRDLVELMWRGGPIRKRIGAIEERAKEAEVRGGPMAGACVRLSGYITLMGGKNGMIFFLWALRPAKRLSESRASLTHNQLDVLLSFMVELRKRPGFFPARVSKWLVEAEDVDETMLTMARWEVQRARFDYAESHEMALAYMTRAYVLAVTNCELADIQFEVEKALSFETAINHQPNLKQGLRQFVRVMRKAGEIYSVYLNDPKEAAYNYEQALTLAREVEAEDQVYKIESLLEELPKHRAK